MDIRGNRAPTNTPPAPLALTLARQPRWLSHRGDHREQVRKGRHLAAQAEQLQLLQACGQRVAVHAAEFQPRLARKWDVHQDFGQHPRAVGAGSVGGELAHESPLQHALGVLGLGAAFLQLIESGIDAVEVGMGLQQRDGRLRTDAFHTRNVVRTVAGERLEVHHLFRGDPQLADHLFAADVHRAAVLGVRSAAHIQNGDVALIVHQLKQVAIAGEDAHPPAGVGGTVGQGAEDIVGFVAGSHAQRDVEPLLQQALKIAQIGKEVLGCFIAMGLVRLIRLVAECGLGRVEGDHHALGLEPAAVVKQRFEEAIRHRRGHTLLGAQPPIAAFAEGIKAAKGQRVAIDQQQQRFAQLVYRLHL